MMTRFTLTLVLVVLLGALVSGGSGVASAGVLPEVSPEGQYRFALGRALQNDLKTGEEAFAEFIEVNKGHERVADATFWLGRVQFMRSKYEHAAMTFSKFNMDFPGDDRLVKSTMWIAESVSHFAPPEEACKIYASLPKLLDNPPKSFIIKLGKLTSAAKCKTRTFKNAASQPDYIEEANICTWLAGIPYRIGRNTNTQNTNPFVFSEADREKTKSYIKEGVKRNLSCSKILEYSQFANLPICSLATRTIKNRKYWALPATLDATSSQIIASLRGLNCGVEQSLNIQTANDEKEFKEINKICSQVTYLEGVFDEKTRRFESIKAWAPVSYKPQSLWALQSVIKDNIDCGVEQPIDDFVRNLFKNARKYEICQFATFDNQTKWQTTEPYLMFVRAAHDRGEKCQTGVRAPIVSGFNPEDYFSRYASNPKVKPKVTSATLTAAEKEAERLRQELASLKAEKAKQQQTISSDTKLPTITIASVNTKGKQGIVKGRVNDNTGIAEVTVDGTVVPVTNSGDFEYSTFVPSGGLSLKVQATDLAGLTSMMSVTLERNAGTATATINFDRLNPLGKRVKINKDALALIIGVADYENTPAKAIFADSDAMMFRDYASEKLGIPESRIKTLVNNGAEERELLLSVKSWLARASKQGKSDVYIFFAGHGLASDNGEKMYLLPYDGSPELLDDTAILRDRLFSDIASANPRSVTVFLDTCYSGTTRGTDMLIASRPIAIKALEQSIPDNFIVMTAARGDQTAKPLEEAKHGMFSYFLMKGMEGDADANQDNKITAGELHEYVERNVVQQSSGSQTPELQGDAERVLVRFQ